MATWSAAETLVVVYEGRPVHLDERYLQMVLWVLDLRERMDGVRSGKLHLSFNGHVVAAGIEESYGSITHPRRSGGTTPWTKKEAG